MTGNNLHSLLILACTTSLMAWGQADLSPITPYKGDGEEEKVFIELSEKEIKKLDEPPYELKFKNIRDLFGEKGPRTFHEQFNTPIRMKLVGRAIRHAAHMGMFADLEKYLFDTVKPSDFPKRGFTVASALQIYMPPGFSLLPVRPLEDYQKTKKEILKSEYLINPEVKAATEEYMIGVLARMFPVAREHLLLPLRSSTKIKEGKIGNTQRRLRYLRSLFLYYFGNDFQAKRKYNIQIKIMAEIAITPSNQTAHLVDFIEVLFSEAGLSEKVKPPATSAFQILCALAEGAVFLKHAELKNPIDNLLKRLGSDWSLKEELNHAFHEYLNCLLTNKMDTKEGLLLRIQEEVVRLAEKFMASKEESEKKRLALVVETLLSTYSKITDVSIHTHHAWLSGKPCKEFSKYRADPFDLSMVQIAKRKKTIAEKWRARIVEDKRIRDEYKKKVAELEKKAEKEGRND